MITEWLLLLAVVVLIAANAMFVAAEFSLVTVDRPTVARLAETDPKAKSLREALKTMSTQLSGAQLGITITSLVVGFIAWGRHRRPTTRSSRPALGTRPSGAARPRRCRQDHVRCGRRSPLAEGLSP